MPAGRIKGLFEGVGPKTGTETSVPRAMEKFQTEPAPQEGKGSVSDTSETLVTFSKKSINLKVTPTPPSNDALFTQDDEGIRSFLSRLESSNVDALPDVLAASPATDSKEDETKKSASVEEAATSHSTQIKGKLDLQMSDRCQVKPDDHIHSGDANPSTPHCNNCRSKFCKSYYSAARWFEVREIARYSDEYLQQHKLVRGDERIYYQKNTGVNVKYTTQIENGYQRIKIVSPQPSVIRG